ncbi:CARDB domain-containing protein [Anaeromyxobacter terrae]|uniref:CARDB domain-containing protein n=1 Tax=Anaeromyxobacter terrae TaxID=2925406 RepID=UPI001F5A2308|nr:CARDB domain-containing protein [Anaeromyxobacter sp. SG22]
MNTRWVVFLAALALAGTASASPGDFIAQIGTPGSGAGQLDAPWGTAVDGSGNVYVTDTANARVQVFSRAGAFLRSWGSLGSGNGQLDGPTGIAVCEPNVYVADTNNNRVQLFDTAGNLVAVYGGMNAPHGLACDDMFLYVADTGNHRVAVIMLQDYGQDWPAVPNGGHGSGPGQYDSPTDVALGADGSVYVADTGNDRIVASRNGVFDFGATGVAEGQLSRPTGVEVDAGGNVYVVDSGNARVQVFTPSGAFVAAFGTPGIDAGQLASPAGIAFDQGGARVVVADSGNDRLQSFQAMTSDLAVTAIAAPPAASTLQQLSFTATVRNLGPGSQGYVWVYGYLSTDPYYSANDVQVCYTAIATLAPGSEQPATATCTVPANAATVSGPAYLVVRATSPSVGDPDLANNVGAAAIQVNGPDLAVASVAAPSSIGTLQPLTVSATVVNRGLGNANGSVLTFSLVSSTTGALVASLGNVAVGALPAGGQQTVTATYTLGSNLAAGSAVVRATADVYQGVPESDESNNVTDSQPLTVYLPDLAWVATSFPASAAQGETVPMTVTLVNQGGGDSKASGVSIVLTRDGSVCTRRTSCDESDDDWWLGNLSVPGLAAGAQVTLTIPVAIPSNFDPLSWPVIGLIDWDNRVPESNNANNIITLGAISILPAATTIIVGVDIKPGSSPNSINLGSNGVVPVAILSSPTFDATTVDPLTVTLASSPIVLRGNGTPSASAEDVNGDGLKDLVVQVATEALQLTTASTSAVLQGRTYTGQAIAGNDDVNIVP